MPFILRQFSSIPSLLKSFNHGWMLNFVKKILHSFWNQCSRPPDIFPQLFYTLFHLFIYHRCCSGAQSHPTLCDPMDCSMPGFPVLHHLPELAQTHVHWLGQWCHPYFLWLFHFKHFHVTFAYSFHFFAEITHLILVYCTPFQLESLTY